jgi:hypothetical protein
MTRLFIHGDEQMDEHERSRVVAGAIDQLHLSLVEAVADGRALRLVLHGCSELWNTGIDFPTPQRDIWLLRLGPNRHSDAQVAVVNDSTVTFGQIRQRFLDLFDQEYQRLTDTPQYSFDTYDFEGYTTRMVLALSEIQEELELRGRKEALDLFRDYRDLD